jgi:hypothetical protein
VLDIRGTSDVRKMSNVRRTIAVRKTIAVKMTNNVKIHHKWVGTVKGKENRELQHRVRGKKCREGGERIVFQQLCFAIQT